MRTDAPITRWPEVVTRPQWRRGILGDQAVAAEAMKEATDLEVVLFRMLTKMAG